ncbi:hypothetical protein UFOVP58_96 [uncultured Caudovirales phage]|uniref:Uncharacterized protein n=1 Tax=uncultured Caudovirales phage TaxID=2100421 RepID=A0A6J5KVN5_9CAUD|nr:hypothetical protein UFOVP58_96 [uncultured Caudovirales phage]
MENSNLIPNLVSFPLVRRGNWVIRVSVFKDQYVLVVYKHYYDEDKVGLGHFVGQGEAADFIEALILED